MDFPEAVFTRLDSIDTRLDRLLLGLSRVEEVLSRRGVDQGRIAGMLADLEARMRAFEKERRGHE